ncbi:MAG: hypothetical protein U0K91_02285 [Acutalibacteraceae bacterium]|nr:hypothetical protein [Acutalibacteraceae bacterium]
MMNDNEIIKALEQHIERTKNIKYGARKKTLVDAELLKDILDLINSQQAEIERLEERIIEVQRCDKELIETLHKVHEEKIETAKAEAIKDFAERLCEGRVSNDPVVIAVKVELKEMVGDNNV